MENASKALIIAGAILLAILLISLGIIIFNQAQDTIGHVNLSEQEIAAFNNKFAPYEGTSIRGPQVNALIQAVVASNQAAQEEGNNDKIITMKYPSGDQTITINGTSTTTAKVTTGATYKVSFTYAKGLVHEINVTKN